MIEFDTIHSDYGTGCKRFTSPQLHTTMFVHKMGPK
jgi:hypothetical protein